MRCHMDRNSSGAAEREKAAFGASQLWIGGSLMTARPGTTWLCGPYPRATRHKTQAEAEDRAGAEENKKHVPAVPPPPVHMIAHPSSCALPRSVGVRMRSHACARAK